MDKTIPHSKPWITSQDREAVSRCLKGGLIAQGALVRRFEQQCAAYLGVTDAVAMGSGTAAFRLGLLSLGLGIGDEVIVPTYVCRNVAETILSVGGRPVFCDLGSDWSMDPQAVKRVLTARTRAVVVVHLFGIYSNPQPFAEFGLPIIEDACQAFGAGRPEEQAGTSGTFGFYSFHATKCLTTGEGGLVVSKDTHLLNKLRRLRDGSQNSMAACWSSPMTDIQAALGLAQLSRYSDFLDRRRKLADRYFATLENTRFRLPHEISGRSIFFRYPLRWRKDFTSLREAFARRGVQVRQGVDVLLHRLGSCCGTFMRAERLYRETVCLPIYPALTAEEQNRIIEACLSIRN